MLPVERLRKIIEPLKERAAALLLHFISALQFVYAVFANAFPVENDDIIRARIIAENAARLVFFEYDTVVIYIYFQWIFLIDAHLFPDFDWKHYAAQFINLTDNTRSLHDLNPLFEFIVY